MAVPALMPLAALATAIATGIGVALRIYIVAAVLKLFVSIGIGFMGYKTVLPMIDEMETRLLASFSELPAEWQSYAGLLQVDVCITIIFSAVTTALAFKGLRLVAR